MDSVVLMLAVRLREDSSVHNKATIRRWVLAVQEHNGSCPTRIPVLGFPQQKQQERHCYTIRHKCRKPTYANKTPHMARRFYLRLHLLCRFALWGCFTSSALLYRSLLCWRAPLPHIFFIALQRPQIFHQVDGGVGIHPILSLWFLQLSPAIAKSGGWH